MSSGSSGSSGDEAVPPPDVRSMTEMAQICHFLSTFRAPLKLSKFSRTELEEALVEASNGYDNHMALLAEIHFKLAREQTGVKLEKMMQEWEKAVAKKLAESWHLEFDTNPMATVSYSNLPLPMRIRILNALCHWKVDSCSEIRKYIAAIQKGGDTNGLDSLRAQEIGSDDNGVSYWYFDDGCWVYAEVKPQWQAQPMNPRYVVEFATAKKIRLSINFNCDDIESNVDVNASHKALSPKIGLANAGNDINGVTKHDSSQMDADIKNERVDSESPRIWKVTAEMVETTKMDINLLCGSPPCSENDQVRAECTVETQPKVQDIVAHSTDVLNGCIASIALNMPSTVSAEDQQIEKIENMRVDEKTIHERNHLDVEEDGKHVTNDEDASKTHAETVSNSGKKRFIVDDDTTDSGKDSDCGTSANSATKSKKSSPTKKKVKLDTVMEILTDSRSGVAVQNPTTHYSADMKSVIVVPSNNPTLGSADSENYDIICECCSKDYDMRYLDPPLVERPGGEWRCFECLVNDARGWPRRRKPSPRGSVADDDEPKSRSSSLKKKSSSTSLKKSNSKSSSSSRKHRSSNHPSSTTSKKSASSKKKHKKKKSSSSSSHHHSHRHHRRRHHHHHQEFAKLLNAFEKRKNERVAIENIRVSGGQIAEINGPTSWRVASSTLEELRFLVSRLAGGSLDQERLKGRLILILKNQEQMYEEQKKQQELAFQVLPRRQSSRIAIGKIRTQYSHDDSDVDVASSGIDEEHAAARSTRSRSSAASEIVGYDSKQRLALERASRARRRQQQVGSDADNEEEDDDDTPSAIEGWIDWSLIKNKKLSLSAVCLALVDRLLKEEIAELFARPVDPELDGCPDYLSVIDHPIDLGTIRSRLQNGFYQAWEIFKLDIDRVWQNCRIFNESDTVVVQYANTLDGMCHLMCSAAEKKGVRQMKNKNSDAESSDGDLGSSSDESRADSKGSVNKEWTESSSSEGSGSSDDGASSGNSSGSNDSDHKTKRQSRSARAQSKRSRPSSSKGPSNGVSQRRSSRQTDEQTSTGMVNAERVSSRRRPLAGGEAARLHKREQFIPNVVKDGISENPPAQSVEREVASPHLKQPSVPSSRLKKSRQISSSSSSSENDENDSSTGSDASMNSDHAESDTQMDHPPPPPSTPAVKMPEIKQASAPPPPPPTSPPALTVAGSSQPRRKTLHRSNASPARTNSYKHGKKVTLRAPALKFDHSSSADREGRASGPYANSPSLLNSYLSPSSSSSSYFSSSADSNSSDSANSDSDS